MRSRPQQVLATVCGVVLLASCGGSPTAAPASGAPAPGGDGAATEELAAAAQEVYDQVNGLTGQERTDELVRLAEEEGELNVYTSNSDMDALVEGFTELYDIDVSVYRAGGEAVLQRLLQEDEAGYHGVDVVETDALELGVAEEESLLYPYQGELRDSVREAGRQTPGWTGTRFNSFVVGWNTDRVPPGTEPTTFEELAEPQWAGRISMEVGDVDWFTALHDYYVEEQGWSEEEYLDLMSRIAANAKVARGHTVQGELLSAGQFDVAISSYSHTIDGAAADGAPVAWRGEGVVPVQPVVLRPNGIGLARTATNPAAAVLFVDYQLTAGQEVAAESFRIGAVAGGEDPLEGLEVYPVPTDKLLEDPTTWNELYEEVVLNGQEVG